jgi:hypothetical protein
MVALVLCVAHYWKSDDDHARPEKEAQRPANFGLARLYGRQISSQILFCSKANEGLLLEYQRRSAYSLPFEVDCHLDPISDPDERNAAVHAVVLAVEGHRPFNLA